MDILKKHAVTIAVGLLMFVVGFFAGRVRFQRSTEGFSVSTEGPTPNYDTTGCYIIKQAIESYDKMIASESNAAQKSVLVKSQSFYKTTFDRLGCGSYMTLNGTVEGGAVGPLPPLTPAEPAPAKVENGPVPREERGGQPS